MICELHKRHSPRHFTQEVHHIIPVAWQLFWKPHLEPYPGEDPNGRGHLWDSRTVTICPTGHRNVHHWIVSLMHGNPIEKRGSSAFEGVCATLALERFASEGGSLDALRAHHLWGQI